MRRAPGFGFAVFFVANQQQGDVGVRFACFECVFHPHQVGGNHGFHIRCAAPMQVIAFDARGELAVIGFGFDHVEVPGEENFALSLIPFPGR